MIPENALSEEFKNELNKIKEIEKMVERGNVVYRANKYRYNFENFWIINTFGRGIPNDSVILKEADKDQSGLLVEILNFRKQIKPKNPGEKKDYFLKNLYELFEGGERVHYIAKYFQ